MNREEPNGPSARWTLLFALGAALIAGLQRETWHPHNFFMIGALGLWGGARLRPWLGLLLPVGVWLITDVIEWRRTGLPAFNPFVGAAFLSYGLLGLLLRRTKSPARIAFVCVLGSVLFFLLTNFSVWLALSKPAAELPAGQAMVLIPQGSNYPVPVYAQNLQGLLACYVMGIPFTNPDAPPLGFLGNVLCGDLLFTGLLFGAHAWLLEGVRRRAVVPVSP